MSVREFALVIGKGDTIVRKWVYGQRQPSLPKALKIEAATAGLVGPKDLLLAGRDLAGTKAASAD